jgi:NAD(P)-dependent dehydrogenase (short-subunit alcohol dehydrogenase family)
MRKLAELMDLSERRGLITGGAGHIGLAVCESLLELGATIAVLDVEKAVCGKRVEALSRIRSGSAIAVPCDLRDEPATRQAVRDVIAKLGGLDIIVHCAAYVGTTSMSGWAVPFEQQTVSAWEAAIQVNLTSAFVIVQEAGQALGASGRGSVIFFGSTYGVVGPDMRLYEGTSMGRQPAGYAASKGGLLQLTRYLATVLAPRVRVNAITPGGVWRGQPDLFHQRYISRTPLGRMADEEDLKGAVAYLASDLSGYVTGQNVIVDGGWTAW